MLRIYFRGKVYGQEKVPHTGPVVVVSNHASYFDPPLLSSCVGRPVAFMAKKELFQVPVLKQAIRLYGAYPVNRHVADHSAIRTAITVLQSGWAIGLFLQGTRTLDAKITNPKLGAAMIAAKAKAPLLPVSLWGTQKILHPGLPLPQFVPVTVRIGDTIAPPNSTKRAELQSATEKCTKVINAMHQLGR